VQIFRPGKKELLSKELCVSCILQRKIGADFILSFLMSFKFRSVNTCAILHLVG